MSQDNYNINTLKNIINDLKQSNNKISNLSEDQKKQIYDYLILELVKKEIKAEELQKNIIDNKLKSNKDVNIFLDSMSKKDIAEFLNFLNNKKGF